MPQKGEEAFIDSLIENAPLAPLTTLGVGGAARYFAESASADTLVAGVKWAAARGLPLFVMGGGSNVVISDEGFPGLVLRVSIRGIEAAGQGDQVIVKAGAGEEWDSLVELSVANGWAGFECLSGIPGRVGATPIQNVGAYGRETSETLDSVEALDLRTLEMVEIPAAECRFGYRMSRFKSDDRGRFVITRVTYRLTAGGRPLIRYAELERYLAEQGVASASLSDVRRAVLAVRGRKAMVIDARDPDSRSVGSFFVNPVVTRDEFEKIKKRAGLYSSGEQVPSFAAQDGHVKLSAAWLIERAGINRGYVRGNVGTSTKHALAIINRGGGTAREVLELAEEIKSRVIDRFGVTLSPEPIFVGMKDEFGR